MKQMRNMATLDLVENRCKEQNISISEFVKQISLPRQNFFKN